MKNGVVVFLLAAASSLIECGGGVVEERLSARVRELQDSLVTYQDSLKDVQTVWSFNTLIALVQMEKERIRDGDSCRADIILAVDNSDDAYKLGYRYSKPRLEIQDSARATITEQIGRWHVVFKPTRLGEDSLAGNIWIAGGRTRPTYVNFSNRYTVLPK